MIYRKEKTKNISFPLGGIGTGCIGLSGNGELIDWEIFNRPNKNSRNGYSHFAISATIGDKKIAKVLHGDTNENLSGGYRGFGAGVHADSLAGFPHFRNLCFEGNFPFAHLTFEDEDFPGKVRLTAFNPMIPHNSFDSSLPAAFFEWEIENTSQEEVEYALAFSVKNPSPMSENCAIEAEWGAYGIFFRNGEKAADEIEYFDLCALTDSSDSVMQEYWYRGYYMDSSTMYWNNFSGKERMPLRHYDEPGMNDYGTLTSYVRIASGTKEKIRFVLAWNMPNQYNYWNPYKDEEGKDVTWKNYYATQFADSRCTAEYAIKHFAELQKQSLCFANALKSSTIPEVIYDAVSANLAVLKSPTVLRMEDGSFWGWEGCWSTAGSCEGSCQHVWNYAYALPYLFPDLERSLRENTAKYAVKKSGATAFRITLPLGVERSDLGRPERLNRACVDGQMGEVIKCYREWKISGDTEWVKKIAPSVFLMLDYARSPENPDKWDADGDGIMEGRQHHTLDRELFGPSSWLQGFYLLALDCGARIADALDEKDRADQYRRLYAHGRQWTNEHLFNGKYFCQQVDRSDREAVARFGAEDFYWNEEAREIKYQVADGCIIDQMLGDWHAALIGLPEIFESEKKSVALKNLYVNNYVESMRSIANMWRNYAVNDESGTIICSYPDGTQKPAIPISYCEEVMTGFEYALAGLMIHNGFVAEGEQMVRAVRDRYDGEKRNPWNEVECGNNYARTMASYALLPIYSGFYFDMTESYMGFNPVSGTGSYLWSVADSWGMVDITAEGCTLSVFGSPLSLASFGLQNCHRVESVLVDGEEISFAVDQERIWFDCIPVKDRLEVKLK